VMAASYLAAALLLVAIRESGGTREPANS